LTSPNKHGFSTTNNNFGSDLAPLRSTIEIITDSFHKYNRYVA